MFGIYNFCPYHKTITQSDIYGVCSLEWFQTKSFCVKDKIMKQSPKEEINVAMT